MGAGCGKHAGHARPGSIGLTARAITAEGRGGGRLPGRAARSRSRPAAFAPSPVEQRLIPKSPGKYRRLGIPTVADRVVQASLVLVLEPIFEADFHPSSYGFRPRRRAWDAVAEIQMFASRSYEWVLEGDITACFDEIDHTALMGRVRRRIGDKRVLALVKAFLKAGILSEDQVHREIEHRHPARRDPLPAAGQHRPGSARRALRPGLGSTISPTRVDRSRRRRHGQPVYRLVRYADDFVVLVSGTREHAEAMREQVSGVLAPMGLRLSPEKTTVVHIDDGFDFLGFRIQRHQKPGTGKRYVYTFPAKKSVASISGRSRRSPQQGTNHRLGDLLRQLNPVLRGWTGLLPARGGQGHLRTTCATTRGPGSIRWLRQQTPQDRLEGPPATLLAAHRLVAPRRQRSTLFDPASVTVTRYRYRGDIPSRWAALAQLA